MRGNLMNCHLGFSAVPASTKSRIDEGFGRSCAYFLWRLRPTSQSSSEERLQPINRALQKDVSISSYCQRARAEVSRTTATRAQLLGLG
jgi:hypothetical protein